MPSHELSKALLAFDNCPDTGTKFAAAADGAADGVPPGAAVPSFLAGASPGSSTPVVLPNPAAAAATVPPTPTRTPAPTPPPKPVYGTSCVLNLAGDFQKASWHCNWLPPVYTVMQQSLRLLCTHCPANIFFSYQLTTQHTYL